MMSIQNWYKKLRCYKQRSSNGTLYYLHAKMVVLRGGREIRIFYFTRDFNPVYASKLPTGYKTSENPRNGFLTVRKVSEPNPYYEEVDYDD